MERVPDTLGEVCPSRPVVADRVDTRKGLGQRIHTRNLTKTGDRIVIHKPKQSNQVTRLASVAHTRTHTSQTAGRRSHHFAVHPQNRRPGFHGRNCPPPTLCYGCRCRLSHNTSGRRVSGGNIESRDDTFPNRK